MLFRKRRFTGAVRGLISYLEGLLVALSALAKARKTTWLWVGWHMRVMMEGLAAMVPIVVDRCCSACAQPFGLQMHCYQPCSMLACGRQLASVKPSSLVWHAGSLWIIFKDKSSSFRVSQRVKEPSHGREKRTKTEKDRRTSQYIPVSRRSWSYSWRCEQPGKQSYELPTAN